MITLQATGVANRVQLKTGGSGKPYVMVRCGFPQRAKRDGEWVTEYVNATIFCGMGAQLIADNLKEGDRFTVFADQVKVETYTPQSGETRGNLKLSGRIELGRIGRRDEQPRSEAPNSSPPKTPEDDDIPF